MKICTECCWYDEEKDKCLEPELGLDPNLYSDTKDDKLDCVKFIAYENSSFTHWSDYLNDEEEDEKSM